MGYAAEAVLIIEYNPPIPMTCVNATGIERGRCLTLSDPLSAATATDSTAACAGICAEEKIALDGKTKVPVHRDGIFKVTASGVVTVGQAIALEYNYAHETSVDQEHSAGIALETAADTETFLIELRPTHVHAA